MVRNDGDKPGGMGMMQEKAMDTGRDCELRAEGLEEVVEALEAAVKDWRRLQERAAAEGLDVTPAAERINRALVKARGLVAEG